MNKPIPALDIVLRKSSYDVFAYDSRHEIALVEIFDVVEKPYMILLGLTWKYGYEWSGKLEYKTLQDAFEIYDTMLFALNEQKQFIKKTQKERGTKNETV